MSKELQTMKDCLDHSLSDNGNADKIKTICRLLYTEIGRIEGKTAEQVVDEASNRNWRRDQEVEA